MKLVTGQIWRRKGSVSFLCWEWSQWPNDVQKQDKVDKVRCRDMCGKKAYGAYILRPKEQHSARTEALILHEIYHSYDVVLHVLQKFLRCAVDDSLRGGRVYDRNRWHFKSHRKRQDMAFQQSYDSGLSFWTAAIDFYAWTSILT